MKHFIEQWLLKRKTVVHNCHFWIIIFIILIITSMYYGGVFIVDASHSRYYWLWKLIAFEYVNHILGSLFWIPNIYAAIIFWWRGVVGSWLVTMVLILPIMLHYTTRPSSIFFNIIFLLVPVLLVLTIALYMRQRELERKELAEREKERQAYITEIFKVQEDERRRISREIHDDTVQKLWIEANNVQKLADNRIFESVPEIGAQLSRVKDRILEISADTRKLSIALRPGILDELGLVPAIRLLIEEINSNDHIEAEIKLLSEVDNELNNEIAIHLFRIAQEALSNVRRHSKATRAVVTLDFNQKMNRLIIWDNGEGFSYRDLRRCSMQDKLGIIGMQERARLLGGTVKINSKRGKGTTILVEFSAVTKTSSDV